MPGAQVSAVQVGGKAQLPTVSFVMGVDFSMLRSELQSVKTRSFVPKAHGMARGAELGPGTVVRPVERRETKGQDVTRNGGPRESL